VKYEPNDRESVSGRSGGARELISRLEGQNGVLGRARNSVQLQKGAPMFSELSKEMMGILVREDDFENEGISTG